uniref:Transmembrane protein 234 n=1 Tax=Nothobranchius furzeri TaxID=105023 RepID=A0A8C6LA73_NOTFU
MVTVAELFSLVLVSVLWGCTNPFLKKGSEGIENLTKSNKVLQLLAEVKFLFLNLKYLVPFLLNQSGSLVYYYTLSTTELSLAVPVANSLTFLFTLLTGKLLGETFGGKRELLQLVRWLNHKKNNLGLCHPCAFAEAVVGMFLTMAGITLCIISSISDDDTEKQNTTHPEL